MNSLHLLLSRMGSVNLVVIVESARSLITHNNDSDVNSLHVPSLISVGAALGEFSPPPSLFLHRLVTMCLLRPIGVKFLLFLYCMSLRRASSQVHVLWEDHRNDLFINGFGTCSSNLFLYLKITICFSSSFFPIFARAHA